MAFAVLFIIWCALLVAAVVTRSQQPYDPLPSRYEIRNPKIEIDLDIRALMDRVGRN